MTLSTIEWTEMTWNPTTGCTKISSGCKHCYAESMSKRLQAMGVPKYKDAFLKVKEHLSTLDIPYRWKSPKIVFVNSMSDLFHTKISDSFIKKVFKVMNENPNHTFQLLTKRANRLASLCDQLTWSKNIWMGVSIENKAVYERIWFLKKTNAEIKFLSCEPLLESLPDLPLKGINWVIVGGESGNMPRPMKEEWVLEIRKQCQKKGIPFFFKQWGGKNKKKNGRLLLGKTYDEMPQLPSVCPDLPGCTSTGETKEDVMQNMKESIKFHIEGMVEDEDGDTVPKPSVISEQVEVAIQLTPEEIRIVEGETK